MELLKKYTTNISALQFIQLLRFAVLFLVSVVFVRFYSKNEIGQYEAFLFLASSVSFFWLHGILQSFLAMDEAEFVDNFPNQRSSGYFNSFLLLLFFGFVMVLMLALFKNQIGRFLNSNQDIPFFSWLLAYIFLSAPSNFIEYLYLKRNKPTFIVLYGVISYGIQFFAVIVPPLIGLSIEKSVQFLVYLSGARFLFLIYNLKLISRFQLSPKFLMKHARLAFPLIFSSLLSGSGQYIDGLIVTHFYDSGVFAIFRYGAREFPLIIILANAFSHAVVPVFGKLSLAESLSKLKSGSLKLMHFLFPVAAVILLSSNFIYTRFFTSDFSFGAKIFNIYLLLIVFRLVFPESILIGMRITGVFIWISGVEVLANVFLSLIGLKLFGLAGIAYATVLANGLERLILFVIVKKKLSVDVREYIPVKWYLSYSMLFILLYMFVDFFLFPV